MRINDDLNAKAIDLPDSDMDSSDEEEEEGSDDSIDDEGGSSSSGEEGDLLGDKK
jgi:hypothetical protein